ncbi:Uncharacterized protein FWK35_00008878 [Aphis craccivora]|uniref:Uncharacterized protein n=1 Tax=Aphis craccivora TaxID=307492 RepID=A0A6G0YRU3_APHCR|nr:Uncharacterized protein FWK35_00008878 [Aphis craccivora]
MGSQCPHRWCPPVARHPTTAPRNRHALFRTTEPTTATERNQLLPQLKIDSVEAPNILRRSAAHKKEMSFPKNLTS